MNLKTYSMKTNDSCSTELGRIQEIKPYDPEIWDKLYKVCKPLVKRLSKQIDARRLNIDIDLVESLFWDKFLFIFNRYQEDSSYEHLKANLLTGLKKYSYRLMRECYTKKSEFYQSHVSFENLYEDSKIDHEFLVDEDESVSENFHTRLRRYLEEHLSEDELMVWDITLNPPPFVKELTKESRGKLSILHLIDYFEFPRTRASYQYFRTIKAKIKLTLEEAKTHLRR